MSALEALERQSAWRDEWEARHAQNWLEQENGLLMPRLLTHHKPIVAAIPDEPPSASVIRELELQINGRVLSPAPKGGNVKYRKKPVVIEAHQWHQNGDHPDDYAGDTEGFEAGELRSFSGEHRKANGWEGSIVRYFRHPDVSGSRECPQCKRTMHEHGWIDTLEGGHCVCPGDFIITGVKGERYPCKPDIFAATYEPAEGT